MLNSLGSFSAFTANNPALFDTRDRWWEEKLMTPQTVCVALAPGRVFSPAERRLAREGELELIARILKGDAAAERWFVLRFEKLIWHLLRTMPLSTHEQDDLFQEVFVRLWEDRCRRLSQWRGEGRGNLASYLRTIVKRQIYDTLRHRTAPVIPLTLIEEEKGNTQLSFLKSSLGPEGAAISKEQRRAIQTALHSLLRRDTELIRRRYYLGQSYKQIADTMEMTVNYVGIALARAEKRLRFKLEERYPGLFTEL